MQTAGYGDDTEIYCFHAGQSNIGLVWGAETDAGSACRTYVAYVQSIRNDLVLDVYLLCGLHQHVLGTGNVVAVAGSNHVAALYSFALLLAMGVYFLRLAPSVNKVVERNLVVYSHPPLAEWKETRELVFDMFFPPPNVSESTKKKRFLYWNLREQFGSDLNGNLFCRTHLGHHCGTFSTCNCKCREDSVNGVTKVLILTVLRRRPKPPSKN